MLNMLWIWCVFLVFLSVLGEFNLQGFSIQARIISKRSLPQYMEYDHPSPPEEHRSNIVKINPRKNHPRADPLLSDVTAFRGIGQDHNSFGGPSYSGQHYPFAQRNMNSEDQNKNFSFGNLLSGLALWNLANEFNTYNNHDSQRNVENNRQEN